MNLHNVTSKIDVDSRTSCWICLQISLNFKPPNSASACTRPFPNFAPASVTNLTSNLRLAKYVRQASTVAALLSLAFGYTAGSLFHRSLR